MKKSSNRLNPLLLNALLNKDNTITEHPTQEALCSLVDNSASATQKKSIKLHLNQCNDCYQEWYQLKLQMIQLDIPENKKSPQHYLQRLSALVYSLFSTPSKSAISTVLSTSLVVMLVLYYPQTPVNDALYYPSSSNSDVGRAPASIEKTTEEYVLAENSAYAEVEVIPRVEGSVNSFKLNRSFVALNKYCSVCDMDSKHSFIRALSKKLERDCHHSPKNLSPKLLSEIRIFNKYYSSRLNEKVDYLIQLCTSYNDESSPVKQGK